jgi:hypothetical protein
LVWRAISSITLMILEILREDTSIGAIALTACATTAPPRLATSRVPLANWLACCAFSAFYFTVAEICSIEADVCSRLAACSSVRCDRSGGAARVLPGGARVLPGGARTFIRGLLRLAEDVAGRQS